MGCKVATTKTLERELRNIVDYLVNELSVKSAANELIAELDNAVGIISEMSEIKNVSTKPCLNRLELREWFMKNHVIVYRLEGPTVFLEHFYHQSQDFERLV